MNQNQWSTYTHLLVKPPLTEEAERCHCCPTHRAFWQGVDNPRARLTDFFKPGSMEAGAFRAGQDFIKQARRRKIRVSERKGKIRLDNPTR